MPYLTGFGKEIGPNPFENGRAAIRVDRLRRLWQLAPPDIGMRLPRTTLGWLPFLWRRVLFPGAAQSTATWGWRPMLALAIIGGVLLLPWMHFPLFEPDEVRRRVPRGA